MTRPYKSHRAACLVVPFLGLLFSSLQAGAAIPTWLDLEHQGARIARIDLRVRDVFDLDNPEEDHWIGRAANAIHIKTKERVVRQSLLFGEGDGVDARVIRETERILRDLPYVREANIVPRIDGDGAVTAVVSVIDAWSLRVGLRLQSVGDDSEWAARMNELNLLGLGKQLLVSYDKDEERTTTRIGYTDPRVLGSHWFLSGSYYDLSDGSGRSFTLRKPFFELKDRWAVGADVSRSKSTDTVYDDDAEVYEFSTTREYGIAFIRWLAFLHKNTAWRIGLELVSAENSYGEMKVFEPGRLPPPDLEDRTLRGAAAYFGLSQDRYEKFRNIQGIAATEDYNLGWDLEVKAGWYMEAMGSTVNAPYLEGIVRKGHRLPYRSLVLGVSRFHGRDEPDGLRDLYWNTKVTFYNQHFPMQTLVADFDLVLAKDLDPETVVYLGGVHGLRGYPNHFRSGDRKWVITVEDRIITPWTLWGIIQFGFVAYAEAGAIRSYSLDTWTKTYVDVGGGLRLGSLKSTSGGTISVTAAFPLVKEPGLDSYQIIISNVLTF
jgi:hypothetical protein